MADEVSGEVGLSDNLICSHDNGAVKHLWLYLHSRNDCEYILTPPTHPSPKPQPKEKIVKSSKLIFYVYFWSHLLGRWTLFL